MSTHAAPEKAYVWLDGDAYRAKAGTGIPTDPFAASPVTGSVTWDPYGGIEAGFELTPTRDVTPNRVWNRRLAPYKVIKSPSEERVKLRAVDFSVATALTTLQGGTISQLSPGVYRWNPGDDEDFALLLALRDESANQVFWSPSVTLTTPPPRTFGKEELDGFEFELLALEPFVPLTSFNPLQVSGTITLPAGVTAGTWTLSFGGQTTTGIAYNAADTAVQSALAALTSIGAGNVTVTGSAGGPYAYTINVPGTLTGDGSGLTPAGTVQIS
ncbi:hypothetical protein IU421_14700 [Nocardia cyriacigeorgica]|uniref:hypothetical protein n=1 Tax=Nocardia cyriacigeorgica TaxID=135487 RepID=UPI00189306A0|nr:hypothetical protein [Nocardia cyriacigeorgica]MBF6515519.1 hypothetical protein [Nocardia cyriacigeorgica]